MTDKQKAYAIKLTAALASRKPSSYEIDFMEIARVKTPKMFGWCFDMSLKVRKNVDNFMLETWVQTAKDERNQG